MSYIGNKPSFSRVRTSELVVQRGADITTAGTIEALDVSNISLVRLTAATVLQGIAAPASSISNGKKVTLVNANSVSLTVSNESGSATAANRISTGTGRNLVITAGASVTLFYNTASSRWSVESSSSEINIDRLKVATESIVLNSADLAPTDSPKAGLIELTAGSQTSVRSISAGVNGQFLVIVNKTGSSLQIANEDSAATAANRIVTGTATAIQLKNDAALFLTYLSSASKWQIVGGSGGGDDYKTDGFKVDFGVYSPTVTAASGVVDAKLGNSFRDTRTGNRTINVHNLKDGQSVTILVQGAATNVITLQAYSDTGTTSIPVKYGAGQGGTMTSVYSLFTVYRVGGDLNFAIIGPIHGVV